MDLGRAGSREGGARRWCKHEGTSRHACEIGWVEVRERDHERGMLRLTLMDFDMNCKDSCC